MPARLVRYARGVGLAAAGMLILAPWSPLVVVAGPSHAQSIAARTAPRPVLAFYYTWYHPSTFCTCTMSDLPPAPYESGGVSTIDRQISEAAQSGISAFITSWPGPGNTQNDNLATLLDREAAYRRRTGRRIFSSVYLESDADAVRGNLRGALEYLIRHDTSNPQFFRWHHKPVIFIWHPIGNGRTLDTWATLRREVDPGHHLLWSAEGTDLSLLSVFDGLHLFSAAYWGLLDGSIGRIDRGFRQRISAYNAAHRTHKIWAAGVEPGYDDTRVPGRTGTYRVPRNNGATYRTSWRAAMASSPDWITITSFNEWFEGSMIEPSRHYGNLYLDLTRYFTYRWRHSWGSGAGGVYDARVQPVAARHGYSASGRGSPDWRSVSTSRAALPGGKAGSRTRMPA